MALAAAVLAVGTAWHYATRPAGDWITDAEAERFAQCMPRCAVEPEVIKSTSSADRLANLEKTSRWEIIRIHHDEVSAAFSSYDPALTACYEVLFNFYGRTGGPHRVDCPADAAEPTR